MYWGIDIRVIGAVLAGIVLFCAGWFMNGYRWDAKYTALKNTYAEAVIKAKEEVKKRELALQAKADQQVITKDEQIKSIRNQLDRALVELRKRPSRSGVSNSSSPAKGSSGADLSREDAEFLVREAARADDAVAQLLYCYRMYDEASGKP